ncbi:1-(5-phosphoribosyl)-5-[(5-phosphoribosylamino) methylideneamino] imidazole-4-carboxamide isomerase [Candidatus Nasuia deltocephalinicola]|uniref:1-(5-phosphoribosyl)-5-[(5-phosphoribosylamino)methylideneamino] imidazole-4-carboxamide isomerase n=1 Tax=Candidatus Nasuia deltocephalincola TaxID=1160784 RepID=A0A974WMZ0_9PROT|nr:1-(5-phosphoribosyl)-5-((5-phosphoribosylamino)methylideneamino)imidazole-4-carboxamide isomerase [Candidatus Nasuia deltocephalinicola]WKD87122.1 HisA/HisF-related TIM barrel protein [Candidatus Nasuia deltocephalinicola]BEH03962.1 1-(5-phosphoribosyl)-5-[(5-phosphoribosylamino) methylideneamino] imidazole-4-carboxamide isomerase [Candidatus Nasuia deltocephalinicola]
MIIIPAIDIKNNNCVRLKGGNIKKCFIFSKNPLLSLNKWIEGQIDRIHLVDLDGAFCGVPKNLITVKNILNVTDGCCETQLGGGIRNIETIEYYLNIGISYIILGTKAIIDFDFLKNVCEKYKKKIIIALDIKNFKIAIDGWIKYYNIKLLDYIKKINELNLESVIYTDINRDGTLKGIDLKKFIKIKQNLNKHNIIISGGLSSIENVKNIFEFQKNNLKGVICGTSIYSGNINFKFLNNIVKLYNNFYV